MTSSVTLRFASVIAVVGIVCLTDDSVSAYSGDEQCLQARCFLTHHNQRLTCEDCIPIIVSDTVYEITLNSLHGSRLIAHKFCNVSWTNVKRLSIYNDLDDYSAKSITDYAFDCLHEFENLKLSITQLINLTANTFYGLLNVRRLDLTDCSKLETPALISAFSLNTVVPKLNKLILSNVGSIYSGVALSQEFIDVLAQRNITELNLSSASVLFENITFGGLCKTLQTLNVSKSHIIYSSSLPCVLCEALQVVDFSGAQLPQSIFLPKNITMKDHVYSYHKERKFEFFSHVSVIYLNYMVSVDHCVYLQNMTFLFSLNNSITELHVSGYNTPIFDVEIIFCPNYITYLDISNNRIERIGRNTFRSLEHLKKLDLSKNKLGIGSKDMLKVLFRNNKKLESLNLAYCELTSLPQNAFEFNNKLEQLVLRGNKITQIHFEITNLLSLMYIDLRSNLIEYLDISSRRQLDTLYNKRKQLNAEMERNESFIIDMRNNPFSCKCDSLAFLVWFLNSPTLKDLRDDYYCKIDNQRISMDANSVAAARFDCDKPARKLRKVFISTLTPCVSLCMAIVVTFLLFKRYRHFKNLQKLKLNIAQIVEETLEYRFPVFLSYASVDSEFVEEHVHHPLKAHLTMLTGTERDLVAIGDRNFRLGRSIFAEIIRVLEDCAVVVIVLSTNYCNSEYCIHEIEQARLMRKPIVVLMKEFVQENEMNAVIKETYKHFTRVTFSFEKDGVKLQQDWEHICQSIIQLL